MIIRRALDDAVRRGLILTNPAKIAHAPSGDHCRAIHRACGTPNNSRRSSPRPAITATTPRCGSPPTPACDTARSSDSAGATSTSTPRSCPSHARSCQSATNSTKKGQVPHRRRSINLDPRTVEVLHAWRQHRENEDPEFDRDDPDSHVFARPDGKPTHPQLLSDAFQKLVAPIRPAPGPLPRSTPHPRNPAPQSRRADQGRQRTTRALDTGFHDGDLPTHHPRHATGGGADLRRHPQSCADLPASTR